MNIDALISTIVKEVIKELKKNPPWELNYDDDDDDDGEDD